MFVESLHRAVKQSVQLLPQSFSIMHLGWVCILYGFTLDSVYILSTFLVV